MYFIIDGKSFQIQQKFNSFEFNRAKNWGGGHPRPTIEGIESSWVSYEKGDVLVDSLDVMRSNYNMERNEYEVLKRNIFSKNMDAMKK